MDLYRRRRSSDSFRTLSSPYSFYIYFTFLKRAAMKKENEFQSALIKELKSIFPGCIVLKNDPSYCQGIPEWREWRESVFSERQVRKIGNRKARR